MDFIIILDAFWILATIETKIVGCHFLLLFKIDRVSISYLFTRLFSNVASIAFDQKLDFFFDNYFYFFENYKSIIAALDPFRKQTAMHLWIYLLKILLQESPAPIELNKN